MKTLEVLDKVLKGKSLRKNTIIAYNYTFNLLNQFTPEFPITPGQINEFLSWLSTNSKLNDSTRQLCYGNIKSAANYMRSFYDDNFPLPFKKGMKPRLAKKQHRIFSSAQLASIINACKTNDERALILGLIRSAARSSDFANLQGKMIGDNSFTVPGKEGTSTYALTPQLCTIFKKMAGSPDGYVFKGDKNAHTNSQNQPMTANAISLRVRRILIRAGITGDKLGAHTLRHSSASLVARKTGSALAVKALLQHAKIETSMVYIHDVEEELSRAIDPLKLISEELFANGSDVNIKQANLLTDGNPSNAIVPVEPTTTNTVDELIASSYPIPPGTFKEIRPRLTREDVLAMRRAFICVSQFGEVPSDASHLNNLYRTLLRRVPKATDSESTNSTPV
jgi:integrase/recombinase XerC